MYSYCEMCFYHTVLDVENIGSTMINVTWKLPVHLSSALLGFQLVLTQEPASDVVEPFVFENVTLNRNEVSYTISGLGMKTILLIKLMYITYVIILSINVFYPVYTVYTIIILLIEPLSEYTINFRIYSNNNIDLIVFGFIATDGGGENIQLYRTYMHTRK